MTIYPKTYVGVDLGVEHPSVMGKCKSWTVDPGLDHWTEQLDWTTGRKLHIDIVQFVLRMFMHAPFSHG